MRYVLDTNVLLYYVRDAATRQFLERRYQPFSDENDAIVSVASVAEIQVLAAKYQWGRSKRSILQQLIDDVIVVEINSQTLIDTYVDTALYSLNIHPDYPRQGSAIKMGKNDLWIAATTRLTEATLLTSDGDFDHLIDGALVKVEKYVQQK